MAVRGDIRTPQALGKALQQARLLDGKSQRDLAAELGISQRWLCELEQGKPGIFTERLFDVLRATGSKLTIEIGQDG